MFFCDFLKQDAQEYQPVGHFKQIGVVKIEFELRITAFGPPRRAGSSQGLRGCRSYPLENALSPTCARRHTRKAVGAGADRVADRCRLALAGLPSLVVAHRDEFGLDAGITDVTGLFGVAHCAFQRLPRAMIVRLPSQNRSAKNNCHAVVPRADVNRVEVGHHDLVGIGRCQFRHVRDRMHSKLRALTLAQQLEITHRHWFRFGNAEQVNPARP